MFKSKESRDTLLLIFMAIIIIAFLLYIFLPRGEKKEKTNIDKNNKATSKKIEKKPVKIKLPDETEPKEENILEEFNQKLENQLISISSNILESEPLFRNYNSEGLKTILQGSENNLVEKLCKFSFFDLNDIARIKFPESYSDSLKFNLFVSLFLIKIQEELIEEAFESLPNIQFEKLVDFDVYCLLGKEIEKDYQLLPILFYFKHLMGHLNIYPAEDSTLFFKAGLKDLRDLSQSKYLVKIQELLGFSQHKETYRLEWAEEDGIFADDKKVYKNLTLNRFSFLKQDYLIFPDPENPENNIWIKELCKSDAGEIELELLNIQNQDPSQHLNIQKIIYTPINAQFVVLLKEYTPPVGDGLLNRLVTKRMEDFPRDYINIDISMEKLNPKLFREELEKFGNHLKKNNPPKKN